MWEKKTGTSGGNGVFCVPPTDCPDPHHVNNRYAYTIEFTGSGIPNGSLFTDFLARINTELSTSTDGSTVADVCFAGHCDWRMPNIAELRTILFSQYPCGTSPCIDPIFGPTRSTQAFYASSTTFSGFFLWGVSFDDGLVSYGHKFNPYFVRVVRGAR